jgi:hypothetical protein
VGVLRVLQRASVEASERETVETDASEPRLIQSDLQRQETKTQAEKERECGKERWGGSGRERSASRGRQSRSRY